MPKLIFPPSLLADGYHFEPGRLVIFRPVFLNDKRIGTIYLQTDLEGMYGQLRLFAGIAVMVLMGSVLVALALSSRLQRPISQPILALAKTARLIAEDKDYTVRVPSHGPRRNRPADRRPQSIARQHRGTRQGVAHRK